MESVITYILFDFIIYSFAGWIIEKLYHYHVEKNFKKKGFLIGPYKPLYGIAMTILVVCKEIFYLNDALILTLCFIIPSVVEYISGYLLRRFFNENYWDYSNSKFNIKGIVTLTFSMYWWGLSIIGVYLVNPVIHNYIFIRFYNILTPVIYVLISIFFIDLASKISLRFMRKYA